MTDYGKRMIANLKPGRLEAFLEAGRRSVLEREVPGFLDHSLLVADDGGTIGLAVRFDSKEVYDRLAAHSMQSDRYPEHDAPHLDAEPRWSEGTWHDIPSPGVLLAEELRRCFAEQRFDRLAGLYTTDAEFDLHVGAEHERRTGRHQICERYAEDFAIRPTFLRWDPVPTSQGAVVEAEALQDAPAGRLRFRWIHLLHVRGGRIQRDTVYCTGGIVSDQ